MSTRSQFGGCWAHSERNSEGLDQGEIVEGEGSRKKRNTLKMESTGLARVKFGMWEERSQG